MRVVDEAGNTTESDEYVEVLNQGTGAVDLEGCS